MGGDPPTTSESTDQMLKSYIQHLPELINIQNSQLAPTAAAQLAADQIASPGYAKLNADLYSQYGPEMNKIGADIAAANQARQSQSDLDIARGTGGQLVTEADKLQRQLDPEFYAQRENLSNALTKYMGSQDPTGLTPNEREEISRSVYARGASNPNSAIDTVGNAMTFGSALQDKQSKFGQAITNAGNVLNNLRSGQSGIQIATGKSGASNSGDTRASGATTNAGGNAVSTSTDFLNQIGQNQRAAMQAQESGTKKLSQVLSWI